MSTGFYAAAAGALMQERILNVLGNNVGNQQTPGFRTERLVSNTFEHELMIRQERGNTKIGSIAPARIVQDVFSDFGSGSFQDTDRPYDMAINSEGFFTVAAADGQQYLTRNGNFDIDDEGYLILRGAGRIQGEKGDILLNKSDFTLDPDGTITSSAGRVVDKLLVQAPDEGTLLTHTRGGLYKIDPAPAATPRSIAAQQGVQGGAGAAAAAVPGTLRVVEVPNLLQNSLETSNIDFNREMSMLMETQRNFQSCSKMLQIIDESHQKMVNIAGQG